MKRQKKLSFPSYFLHVAMPMQSDKIPLVVLPGI